MKKIAIVTVNFNTEEETLAWLTSMQALITTDFQIEIIIIDNGSQKVFVLPKEKENKNIHIFRSDVNTGFAGGYNIGMRKAMRMQSDYIMIVNNDTYADKNLLVNLVKAIEKNKHVGVAAPKIYFAKGQEFHKDRYTKMELGKVFWYAGGHPDWNNVMSIHRGVNEVDHGQYDKEEVTQFASGCCMFFKKEVLEKVGLLDERYFLYYEDANLNERIKRARYKIMYVPSAVLWHINAASSGGSGNTLQDYFLTRNRLLLGTSYAPLRTKIALLRQSLGQLLHGRPMQKKAIKDFVLRRFGKGTYFDIK